MVRRRCKTIRCKKAIARRRNKASRYKQTGIRKSIHADRMRKAKRVGWRVSKKGKLYSETRKNRSDKKGKRI